MISQTFEISETTRQKKLKKRKFINTAEMIGMGIMLFGVVLLFQPFHINIFMWGFPVLLIGYTVYSIFGHIPR